MDLIVIALYMAAMIAIGWFSRRRARTESDYLVAGRRLGPMLYAGTMAALVMGGGATLGGIGLGYQNGLAGVWIVFSMAAGVALISLLLAPLINRLRVYTVSQMLELRYGNGYALISGAVMLAYTLMIAVTSTIAYGAIFSVLFDIGKVPAILIGSSVVILYSALGGMWSITLTDFVQFLIKTVSIFFILLPMALWRAGGLEGLAAHLPPEAFSFTQHRCGQHLHLHRAVCADDGDRAGPVAARVHRPKRSRGALGRPRRGRVLLPLWSGGRADRHGGESASAGHYRARSGLHADRAARSARRALGTRRRGRACGDHVDLERCAHRDRNGCEGRHPSSLAPSSGRSRRGSLTPMPARRQMRFAAAASSSLALAS